MLNTTKDKPIPVFLPHVDQTPYTLEPVGRADPTDHNTAHVSIKRFKIVESPVKKGPACICNASS
jgi:hypothetical protein